LEKLVIYATQQLLQKNYILIAHAYHAFAFRLGNYGTSFRNFAKMSRSLMNY